MLNGGTERAGPRAAARWVVVLTAIILLLLQDTSNTSFIFITCLYLGLSINQQHFIGGRTRREGTFIPSENTPPLLKVTGEDFGSCLCISGTLVCFVTRGQIGL